jgi:hypothetical protein
MRFWMQLLAGACVVVVACAVILAFTLSGHPISVGGWGVVFFCIWALSYICMRKKWYSMLVSMLMTGLVLYAAILTFLPKEIGRGH